MTEENPNDTVYRVDVPIPSGNMVTHSITAIAMLTETGDIELVVSTRGNNTTTAFLGLLAWAQHDILTWK